MAERPSLLSFIPDRLTLPLLAIVLVLALSSLGFIIGAYTSFANGGDPLQALYGLIAASIYLIPAIGIWKLKGWARRVQLFLSIFNVAMGFLQIYGSMTSGNASFLFEGVLNVVLHGLIAIYLLGDNCRRVFGLIPPPPAE